MGREKRRLQRHGHEQFCASIGYTREDSRHETEVHVLGATALCGSRLGASLSRRFFHFHLSSFATSKKEIGEYTLAKNPKLCFINYTCFFSIMTVSIFVLNQSVPSSPCGAQNDIII